MKSHLALTVLSAPRLWIANIVSRLWPASGDSPNTAFCTPRLASALAGAGFW